MDHRLHDGLRPVGTALSERPQRNPFRNEADAFRILLFVAVAAILVIASAAVFGTTAGAFLGLFFLLLAGYLATRWLRLQLEAPDEDER